jgi:hypothetical protein
MDRHLSGAAYDRRRRSWGGPAGRGMAGIGGGRVFRGSHRALAKRLPRRLTGRSEKTCNPFFLFETRLFLRDGRFTELVSAKRPREEPTLPRFARAFSECTREASRAAIAGAIAERAGSFAEVPGSVASPFDPLLDPAGSIQKTSPRSPRAADGEPRRLLGSTRAKLRSRRPRPKSRRAQLRKRRALGRSEANEPRFRRTSSRIESSFALKPESSRRFATVSSKKVPALGTERETS